MSRIRGELTEKLERELLRAKIRNVTAQAEKTEFKTSITRGEYIRVSDVKKKWADDVMKVRSKLLGMGAKIAGRLANVDAITANEIVNEAVKDALKELAEEFSQ